MREDFSARWGVKPNTLSKWLSRYEEGGPKALEAKPVGPDDKRRRRRVAEVVQGGIVRTRRAKCE